MGGEDRIDWRLHELTEEAVAEGLLDAGSRAYDITQQVIHQGFHSLTPAQRQAYITEAVPALNEMMRRRFIGNALITTTRRIEPGGRSHRPSRSSRLCSLPWRVPTNLRG
jgi:hypothetical protein